jgi:hypothetical protein
MKELKLGSGGQALKVLCLGAHSDDIEIGCAGCPRARRIASAGLLDWVARAGDENEARRALRPSSRGRGKNDPRDSGRFFREGGAIKDSSRS